MIQITRQQYIARWDLLSDTLREAMFEPENTDVLIDLESQYSLSEAQAKKMARLSAWVIAGLLPLRNLPEELTSGMKLQPETAVKICSVLDQKIFSKYKDEIGGLSGPSPLPEVKMPPLGGTFGPGSITVSQNRPPAPSIPSLGPTTPSPAPKLLHSEEGIRPIFVNTSSQPRSNSVDFARVKSVVPSAPARVELGVFSTIQKQTPGSPTTKETPAPRVVHYSQWSSAPKTNTPNNTDAPAAPVPLGSIGFMKKTETPPPPPSQETKSPHIQSTPVAQSIHAATITPPATQPPRVDHRDQPVPDGTITPTTTPTDFRTNVPMPTVPGMKFGGASPIIPKPPTPNNPATTNPAQPPAPPVKTIDLSSL